MAEIRQIQVDGVNYDLVISEDEVSATAAAQSAAQALAYKNQAQSSAAQAQTQATNASNQADRAEDAASRAEQIVGGQFVSYGGNQGLSDTQKEQARNNINAASDSDVVKITSQTLTSAQQSQARANIMAGGSNRNLLDNWYFVGGGSQLGDGVFPINQRGQTQYAWSGATCIDRWYIFSANDTVTLSSSGLTVNANENGGVLGQRIRYYPEYSQQPLICTFLTTDNKRIVWSFTINTSKTWQGGTLVLNECPDFYVDALYDSAPNTVAFVLAKSFDNIPHSIALKAAKLELGTVSTLANDPPPDFGEELRKCQRYFVRFSPKVNSRAYIGTGSANNSNNMLIFVPTPVTLRTTPTVSFSMCNCYNWVVGGAIGLNAINFDSWSDNGVFVSCVPADTSQAPQGQPYALRVASGGFFDLSCEL